VEEVVNIHGGALPMEEQELQPVSKLVEVVDVKILLKGLKYRKQTEHFHILVLGSQGS
jgi:hypothetical protein